MTQPKPTAGEVKKAALNADWQQVSLNCVGGGEPCFHLDRSQFCLRGKVWMGHGDKAGHKFVSFKDFLFSFSHQQSEDIEAERDAYRKELQLVAKAIGQVEDLADDVTEGTVAKYVQITMANLASQQAAPLVEALETLKWLIDMQADLKHRASQQDTNAYDKAVAALATYHAKHQEGK